MASPGPIDNMWMINVKTNRPFAQLIEETDERAGDYRKVPNKVTKKIYIQNVLYNLNDICI